MPREEDRTAEDWARYAAKKAEHAADHALDAHAAVGRLAGDVGRLTTAVTELRTELRDGLGKLDGKVRKHQKSLSDLQEVVADDPADDTQIRALKATVKELDAERQKAEKRKEFWVKFAASAVSAGIAVAIGALLLRWLHL
jgi:signal transduction protein with GAF and PtsI domain